MKRLTSNLFFRIYIWRNAAEREIQTFKNHFIAVLSSKDKKFPMHLWYLLPLQANTTVNILCQYCLNPRLLSESHLNDPFYFNQMTLPLPRHQSHRTLQTI